MDSSTLDSSLAGAAMSAPHTPSTQAAGRQQIMDTLVNAAPVTRVPVSREALEEPMARINETLRQRGLEFELSEEPSRLITRVIDRETREVIRQIPSEEALAVFRHIEEMQGGLISLEA